MKTIRRNVFETNSSSTHSLILEKNYRLMGGIPLSLPDNNGYELGYFDILSRPLIQDGVAEGSVDKLRVIVALITECIYYEYSEKVQQEWVTKNGLKQYRWSYEYQAFKDKKMRLKGARDFVLNHRFWKYLNALLKKKLNIHIKIYEQSSWFPYVSEFVDTDLGCESSHYFREIGINFNTKREDFIRKMEQIIFDDEIVIYQDTSERH